MSAPPPTSNSAIGPSATRARQGRATLGRVALAAVVLLVLSRLFNLHHVWVAVSAASLPLVIAGIAFGFSQHMLNSGKWWLLIRARGLHLPYLRLLALNFISIMYGTLLPGQLAGEVVKIHRLARQPEGRATLVATVFLDRVTGLIGLVIAGAVGLTLSSGTTAAAWTVLAAGTALIAAVIVGVLLIGRMAPRARTRFTRIHHAVSNVTAAVAQFRQHPRTLGLAVMLSIGFQALGIAGTVCFTHALQMHVAAAVIAWVFAVVSLIQLLPVTIAGIGPREGALVFLLGRYHVTPAQALALSLLLLSGILSIAAAGILTEISGRTQHPVA